MTEFTVTHDFDASYARYWELFFDPAYNEELNRRLEMRRWEVLERVDEGATMRWRQRFWPKRDLPAFVQKVLRGDLGFVETGLYHKADGRIEVVIEPTLMPERTRITATYTVTALGPDRCRRTFNGQITVHVPLFGGRIERIVVDDMTRSYALAADVTREWLARAPAPAGAAQPLA